ncbi:heparinase II/III family protein [Asticcacaulis tiandongensis]|uniref:heparinase II/III family protein n=1 Tax=Asticcacaulis tiandongensis TaxID=2565365 RepID=UPI001125BCCC|nr:heparinase II/III family protein [Asticcacaulis tiandongensis]
MQQQAYEQNPTSGYHIAHAPWAKIILAWVRKQSAAEWFGMPGYRMTLKGPSIEGFIAAPHEIRPTNALLGRAIMSGRFTLAGARMSTQGSGDPWNRPSPTRAFAIELHRFAWLSPLMTQGDDGAKEALRLFLLWERTFRKWTPFVWAQEVLARRLINLSLFARRMAIFATEDEVQILAQSMAAQARHLSRLSDHPAWFAQKAVALTLTGCALSGRIGDGFRHKGLKLLLKALKRTLLPDGTPATRNPLDGLNLLYDLLLVEDGLNQRGETLPEEVETAIERLSRFVRTLSHPDGSLCAFQGAEALHEDQIAPALLRENNRPVAPAALPHSLEHGRYHRLNGRSLSVYVDTGEARSGALGYGACDHPMGFEVSGGRDKLFVAPGWSPQQSDRHEFRMLNAANGLQLNDAVILTPVTGRFGELLHFALHGPHYRIRSRRVEAEDAGSLLEMEHDGWRSQFGLKHERRLYVDIARDELRGEERLLSIDPKREQAQLPNYTVRFILHPDVQASLARDKKSILLRGLSGRGWWLRHDAREAVIEEGAVFDKGAPRKTTILALRGMCRPDGPTRVRWKLSPAES